MLGPAFNTRSRQRCGPDELESSAGLQLKKCTKRKREDASAGDTRVTEDPPAEPAQTRKLEDEEGPAESASKHDDQLEDRAPGPTATEAKPAACEDKDASSGEDAESDSSIDRPESDRDKEEPEDVDTDYEDDASSVRSTLEERAERGELRGFGMARRLNFDGIKVETAAKNPFDMLPDLLVQKIFSYLAPVELYHEGELWRLDKRFRALAFSMEFETLELRPRGRWFHLAEQLQRRNNALLWTPAACCRPRYDDDELDGELMDAGHKAARAFAREARRTAELIILGPVRGVRRLRVTAQFEDRLTPAPWTDDWRLLLALRKLLRAVAEHCPLEEVTVDADVRFDVGRAGSDRPRHEAALPLLYAALRPARAALASLRLHLGLAYRDWQEGVLPEALERFAELRTLHLSEFAVPSAAAGDAAALARALPRLRSLGLCLFQAGAAENQAAKGERGERAGDGALAAFVPLASLEELVIYTPPGGRVALGDGLQALALGPAGRSLARLWCEGPPPVATDGALRALAAVPRLSAAKLAIDLHPDAAAPQPESLAALARHPALASLALEFLAPAPAGAPPPAGTSGPLLTALAAAVGASPSLRALDLLGALPADDPAALGALLAAARPALGELHVRADLAAGGEDAALAALAGADFPGLRALNLGLVARRRTGPASRPCTRSRGSSPPEPPNPYGSGLRAAAAAVARQRARRLRAVRLQFDNAQAERLAGELGQRDAGEASWTALLDDGAAAELARAAGGALREWDMRLGTALGPCGLEALEPCPALRRARVRLLCRRGQAPPLLFAPFDAGALQLRVHAAVCDTELIRRRAGAGIPEAEVEFSHGDLVIWPPAPGAFACHSRELRGLVDLSDL